MHRVGNFNKKQWQTGQMAKTLVSQIILTTVPLISYYSTDTYYSFSRTYSYHIAYLSEGIKD